VPDEASVPITLLRCHPGSKSDASASTIREHYMVFNILHDGRRYGVQQDLIRTRTKHGG